VTVTTAGVPGAAEREALRRKLLTAIPAGYSPALHFALPSLFGVATVVASLALIRDLRPWQLLVIPINFLLSNATEWRTHRYLLHRRRWPLGVLYDRHTPEHHRIFITCDMAIRSPRELRLVLIPAYGILTIFLAIFPVAAAIWLVLGQRNVALLYTAMSMGYSVSYEWLHLSYHLPRENPISRLGFIAALRRHHATHHDPRLMQKWNFNVTFPVWDWVRGTIYRGTHPVEASEPRSRTG
jgi:sterol desaturase/sphingolipid hydroxylase (fatty acid hydroxylase superfamily)